MKWINASERLPAPNTNTVIYAARWMASLDPPDVLGYTELTMLPDNKIRVGDNVFPVDYPMLAKIEWLDEIAEAYTNQNEPIETTDSYNIREQYAAQQTQEIETTCEWGDGWKDCGGYTKQIGDGKYCSDCGRKIMLTVYKLINEKLKP